MVDFVGRSRMSLSHLDGSGRVRLRFNPEFTYWESKGVTVAGRNGLLVVRGFVHFSGQKAELFRSVGV